MSARPRRGRPVGDAERLVVTLAAVPSLGQPHLPFGAAIYDAAARRQTFRSVRGAYVRVLNHANGVEIARYTLDVETGSETCDGLRRALPQPARAGSSARSARATRPGCSGIAGSRRAAWCARPVDVTDYLRRISPARSRRSFAEHLNPPGRRSRHRRPPSAARRAAQPPTARRRRPSARRRPAAAGPPRPSRPRRRPQPAARRPARAAAGIPSVAAGPPATPGALGARPQRARRTRAPAAPQRCRSTVPGERRAPRPARGRAATRRSTASTRPAAGSGRSTSPPSTTSTPPPPGPSRPGRPAA